MAISSNSIRLIQRKRSIVSKGSRKGVSTWYSARVRELEGALQNAMGHLDTPIARRKLGIDPDAEWLREARDLVESKEGK